MFNRLLQLLFPSYCIWCKTPWPELCFSCLKTLQSHPEICPSCHKQSSDYRICTSCKAQQLPYDGIVITFVYTGLIKKLILALKYYHKYTIAWYLAQKLATSLEYNRCVGPMLHQQEVVVTYVPSHWRRRRITKGYNQSELLAQALAAKLNLPFQHIVRKSRYTKSQTQLDRDQRRSNVAWSYVLQDNIDLSKVKMLIIVDDLATTGSTIQHVAQCIKSAYPHIHIRWAVLARSNS